jgi:hypothetical protein
MDIHIPFVPLSTVRYPFQNFFLGVPRYKRALPPGYLDVPGYDLCLEEHSPLGSSHTEYCRPATKPDYCSNRSWNDLKNVFDGINCPSNDPPVIGGIDELPPAYLKVPVTP